MNHYNVTDIKVGHKESLVFEVNEAKMKAFLELTGDNNPLHNDLDYARAHGFNEKVIYGMLTASAFSTLAGVYLPGEKSLIHSVEVSFLKPVLISDCPLTVEGEVKEVDERFKRIVVKTLVHNNSGEKVAKGIMKIGFLEANE